MSLRLTPDEFAAVEAAAQLALLSLNRWVRDAIREKLDREKPEQAT